MDPTRPREHSPRRPIAPLPAEVVDRIAAGEVIERPASVVRELIENALDAGAGAIRIELREGGLRLLRVADDGCGIGAGELVLACQPHTTSKLRALADLSHIPTLGFRGEALASIAAVAELEVTSAADESGLAHALALAPGAPRGDAHATSRARGTTITVRNLFQTVPARRAMFPRSAAEATKVVATFRAYALTHPEVRFSLVSDGHLIAQTPGRDLAAAVAALYGADAAAGLLAMGPHPGVAFALTGAIAARGFTYATREHVVVTVNGRPIHNRALLAAAETGYRPLLRKGRHPLLVARVEVPPEGVDVNVHPAKIEVLLRAERTLAAALRDAVADALGRSPTTPFVPRPAGFTAPDLLAPLQLHFPSTRRRRGLRLAERRSSYVPHVQHGAEAMTLADLDLLPLAQFDDTLILAQSRTGDLFLVDQHRAHERVLYERLRAEQPTSSTRGEADGPGSAEVRPMEALSAAQALLEPLLIELTPRQAELLAPRLAELAALGIEVQPFGGSAFLLRTVPYLPGAANSAATQARALLSEAVEDTDDWRDRICVALACRSAIRRGQTLTPQQQRALLADLRAVSIPAVCPHGSPLLMRYGRDYLTRAFEW